MKKLVWLVWFTPLIWGQTEWSLNLDVVNQDLWRGLQYSEEASIQPEFMVSHKGFSLLAWGAADISGENKFDFNRTEITLQYERPINRFWLTGGWSFLNFDQGDLASTQEIFLGIGHADFLNPGLQVYYDVDQVKGWYAQFGIFPTLHWFENKRSTGLEIGFILGGGSDDYNGHYFMDGHGVMSGGTGTGGTGGDMGGGEMGGGDMGGGTMGGNGGMPQNASPASGGIFQYMVSFDYPISLGKGELGLMLNYLTYAGNKVRSPMNIDKNEFWIYGLSYRLRF